MILRPVPSIAIPSAGRSLLVLSWLAMLISGCSLFESQEEAKESLQRPKEQPLVWKVTSDRYSPPLFLMAYQYPNAKSHLTHGMVYSDVVRKVDSLIIPFEQPINRVYRDLALTATFPDKPGLDSVLSKESVKQLKAILQKARFISYQDVKNAPPLIVAEIVIPALRGAANNPTYALKAWKQGEKAYKPTFGALDPGMLKKGYQEIPYDSQKAALKTVLKNEESVKANLYDMAEAYEIPNYKAIREARKKAYPFPSYYEDAVIQPATNKWAKTIQEYAGSNAILALVGTQHLQGKNGLLKQLKEAGYKLEPYEYEVFKEKQESKDDESYSNPLHNK